MSFILSNLVLFSQNAGHPLYKNYEPSEYEASPQNWELVHLPSGHLCVANEYGLMTYNGRQWKLYEEEVDFLTRSMYFDGKKLLVGIENDILEISTDSLGQLQFESILQTIPDSISNFGGVEQIKIAGGSLVFHSQEFVFSIKDDQVEWAYSESAIQNMFVFDEVVYLTIEDQGLFRFEDGTFLPIIGGKVFQNDLPVWASKSNNSLLFVTEHGSFYECQLDKHNYEKRTLRQEKSLPLAMEGMHLVKVFLLENGWYGAATLDNGFFVLDSSFEVLYHLNEEMGLQNDIVYDVKMDSYGSIWLAMNNGISKVDVSYPMINFDSRQGLEGTIEAMNAYDSSIYISSHSGLYAYQENKQQIVELLPIQTWDYKQVQSSDGIKQVVATNEDVSELKANGELAKILDCYPWRIYADGSSMLIGTDPGAIAAKHENGNWVIGQESDVESAIGNFTTHQEGIFLGTREGYPYLLNALKWKDDSVIYQQLVQFNEFPGMERGAFNAFVWQGDAYFGTGSGLFRYDGGRLIRPNINSIDTTMLIHRVYNHLDEQLWMVLLVDNELQFGYLDKEENWNYRLFNPVAKDIVHSIQATLSGSILLGGAGGLYQYNRNQKFEYDVPYQTTISKVSVLEDSLIFSGYWTNAESEFTSKQPTWAKPEFHYLVNAIAFEYASISFGEEEDIYYSYWLEGNDKKWSKWTQEHKKEYTNLPPGKYRFKIKAKNVFGVQSEVTNYEFTVRKPWFQTAWYYALQTSVMLILVGLTVFLNRSGNPSPFSSIIAFVTIITMFEFFIMTVEPYFIAYTGEIPVFNLIMNVILAASLAPVEKLIRKFLARKNHV